LFIPSCHLNGDGLSQGVFLLVVLIDKMSQECDLLVVWGGGVAGRVEFKVSSEMATEADLNNLFLREIWTVKSSS
jgi:hypothetical protein